MKKLYMLMICVLAFIGMANAQTQHLGEVYDGSLSISLAGAEPIPVDGQSVYINNNGDGTCTFALYEFKLDPTGASMGDIVVEKVTVTEANGEKQYKGFKDPIFLTMATPNDIEASATLNGTEKANGELVMNIDVLWKGDFDMNGTVAPGEGLPITVIFTGKHKDGGVNSVVANNAVVYGVNGAINVAGFNGVANVYSISGQLVKSAKVANNASIEMPVGIYFVRTGAVATKVVVK